MLEQEFLIQSSIVMIIMTARTVASGIAQIPVGGPLLGDVLVAGNAVVDGHRDPHGMSNFGFVLAVAYHT